MLKFALAALATRLACIPATMRPSSNSIGIRLAPRAAMAAPFTRSMSVWLPVPSVVAAL